MASLAWAMVTDAAGEIGEAMALQNRAGKGKTGSRTILMHPEAAAALVALQTWRGNVVGSDQAPPTTPETDPTHEAPVVPSHTDAPGWR
jgi:hypothetical protein